MKRDFVTPHTSHSTGHAQSMIPYERNLIDATQPFLFPAGSALFANRFLTFESNAAFDYSSRLKQELSSAHVKFDV